MGKTDNSVLKEMTAVIILWAVLLQVICLFVPGDRLRMSAGVWLGALAGCLMAVHMKQSLDEALGRTESQAQRYLQKTYALRYTVVAVVFIAAAYLDFVNILTLFFGVMGLKIAAYLQPVMHRIFVRLGKERQDITGK